MFFPAADTIAFTEGGVESMRITSTGDVGVGTTSPNLNGVNKELTVSAGTSGTVRAAINIQGSRTTNSTFGALTFFHQANNVGSIEMIRGGADNSGVMQFFTASAGAIAECMRINSSGNVGIGSNNPAARLTIASGADEPLSWGSTDAGYNYATIRHHSSGDLAYYGACGGAAITSGSSSDFGLRANQGAMLFATNGNNERMRIDSSGNVGIGATSISRKLQISQSNATTYTGDFDAAPNQLYIVNTNTTTNAYTGLQMDVGSNSQAAISAIRTGDGEVAMAFGTRVAGVRAERMRITSGGNLLVGTTAAGADAGFSTRLAVDGGSSVDPSIFKWTGAATSAYPIRTWNTATSGNNLFVDFATETAYTSRGFIDYNRGAGQVRYNATSDATLKNIIGDSDGQKSINILKSTRIREYAWKEDESQKPQIGVIAQELYETYKGAVSVGGEDKNGNYRPWGVDKTAFTFHLIAGWQAHEKLIQEQQAMIEELKQEVALLKSK